jgi:hypothetical protein
MAGKKSRKKPSTTEEGEKPSRTKQWTVTLDDYHRFVVLKYKNLLGVKKSEAMARMVEHWVATTDIPEKAGASFEDWIREKPTWRDDEHD